MTLASGSALGPYEILSPLGKGGMGEVYKARDARLKREVAIKVLPEEFSRDSDRIIRFKREAEALAALNHSNIASIYHLEETEGVRFLVLELVDGETLEERLRRGPLGVEDARAIAGQICDALEAAHDKGIIHRDLKPANIKITAGGKVKLLDFGLARLFEGEIPEADRSNSPTLISRTNGEMILGTASYMSPEQARGQRTGKQSDIWGFGCVLYEMVAGRRAFEGETTTDTLSAIIKAEPDWMALPQTVPPNIELVLRRCLHKDSRHRLHDIADARIEIEETRSVETDKKPAAALSRPARWIAATTIMAALFATGIVTLALYWIWPQPGRELRLQVITPPTDDPMSLALSPDGSRLVFTASMEGKNQLWIRNLESVAVQPLAGTEGATFPFWSPDSRSLGFFAGGKLKRMDLAGGPPRDLTDAPLARGGSWNGDGVILFAPAGASAIFRVSAEGGASVEVTKKIPPLHTAHRFPLTGRKALHLQLHWKSGWTRYIRRIIGHAGSRAVVRCREPCGLCPVRLSGLRAAGHSARAAFQRQLVASRWRAHRRCG